MPRPPRRARLYASNYYLDNLRSISIYFGMADEWRRPGYQALRKGRISLPFTRYFLTFALEKRRAGLATEEMFAFVESALERVPGHTLALVVMPDHLHWLVRLGEAGDLPDLVRAFKGPLSVPLRTRGLRWQKGAYHDRRLRADDKLSPFLRYMLCNPYRAGLCGCDSLWPFWYRSSEVGEWFDRTTLDGRPFPEWIQESKDPPWQDA